MVTFSEFPNEISLCINISQCPCNCPGCHSSYLAEDIGEPLGELALHKLITDKYAMLDCCKPFVLNTETKQIEEWHI